MVEVKVLRGDELKEIVEGVKIVLEEVIEKRKEYKEVVRGLG